MFDLVVGIRSQHGKIRLERSRAGRGNPLGKAAVDEVALAVVKRHAGPAIEKFAKPPDVVLRDGDGTSAR